LIARGGIVDVRYKRKDGTHASVTHFADLRALIDQGEIGPETPVFDMIRGAWCPAAQHSLTRKMLSEEGFLDGASGGNRGAAPRGGSGRGPSVGWVIAACIAVVAAWVVLPPLYRHYKAESEGKTKREAAPSNVVTGAPPKAIQKPAPPRGPSQKERDAQTRWGLLSPITALERDQSLFLSMIRSRNPVVVVSSLEMRSPTALSSARDRVADFSRNSQLQSGVVAEKYDRLIAQVGRSSLSGEGQRALIETIRRGCDHVTGEVDQYHAISARYGAAADSYLSFLQGLSQTGWRSEDQHAVQLYQAQLGEDAKEIYSKEREIQEEMASSIKSIRETLDSFP
jgi:hypothetical protein